MANTYYDSQLTAAEIEAVLEAINGILTQANNGKVLAISNGKLEARSVQWGGSPTGTISITENGLVDVAEYAYANVNVSGGGGGGGSGNILTGTSYPSASQGSNGAIYLMYTPAGVKVNQTGQYFKTGKNANSDCKILMDFKIVGNQTYPYPAYFGGRPNSGNTQNAIGCYSVGSGTTGYIDWTNQNIKNSIGAAAIINYPTHIELSNGNFDMNYGNANIHYDITEFQIPSTTEMFIFQHGCNGSPLSGCYLLDTILYNYELWENGILVQHLLPAKDQNDVVCLLDDISGNYLYHTGGSGTLEYVESESIIGAFLKVNGAWQNLIGSDISDVDIGT